MPPCAAGRIGRRLGPWKAALSVWRRAATTPSGWTPTVDTHLGRIPKARILEAVREAKGDAEAQRISHLEKGDMAGKAEALLAGSGWLPEPLRTRGRDLTGVSTTAEICPSEPEMPRCGTARGG